MVGFVWEGAEVTDMDISLSAVPGEQTVPRAETQALRLVCEKGVDNASVEADAVYVIQGMHKVTHTGPSGVPTVVRGRNGDLWQAVQVLAEAHPCQVSKVKAHLTARDVAAGRISFQS